MISGETRLAGVIGDPVRHSLSPAIHNAAFAACELDWVYLALPVSAGRGDRAVEAMKTFGIDGLSVTMPHKAAAAAAADDLTPAAAALQVSNCLFWQDGRVIGDSTDGDGFVAAFDAEFEVSLSGKRVLVAGAGGAARSIVEAVGRTGASEIVITNRSAANATAVAALAPQAVVGEMGDIEQISGCDVVVNATAVGMAGGPDPSGCPVPVEGLHEGQVVIDIVYRPLVTPLLAAAAERGAATGGGLGMLVHQAAVQFEHWTGRSAPVEVMTGAVVAASTDPEPNPDL